MSDKLPIENTSGRFSSLSMRQIRVIHLQCSANQQSGPKRLIAS